jgi:hypothetical protein
MGCAPCTRSNKWALGIGRFSPWAWPRLFRTAWKGAAAEAGAIPVTDSGDSLD